MEGDAYPVHSPEKSILIDGSIGENSLFHQTHGYYGHGVSPETATLPDGWKERTIPLQIDTERGIVAHCLEKHDLAYSKLAAGREKDFDFIGDLLKFRLINRGKIQRLINTAQDATLREKLTRNWTIATSKLERREGRGPKSPVTLSSLQSPRRTGGPGDSRPNTLGGR